MTIPVSSFRPVGNIGALCGAARQTLPRPANDNRQPGSGEPDDIDVDQLMHRLRPLIDLMADRLNREKR